MSFFSIVTPALGAVLGAQDRARWEERRRREDEVLQSLRKTSQSLEEPLNHPSAPSQTMTDQSSPITPPTELVQQWVREWTGAAYRPNDLYLHIATRAVQWGANQELAACCVLIDEWGLDGEDLMECRRPKPPSLKKQAYAALDTYIYGNPDPGDKQNTYNTIRRALEQLND